MKKALKFSGVGLIIIISILILVFMYFKYSNHKYLGNVKAENVEYLKSNEIDFESLKIGNSEKLFPNDFYEKNIFLLGENHGTQSVQEIDYTLLIHLNKTIGLKYYLAEMDSIRANQLNSFLNDERNKDMQLLKTCIKAIGQMIPQQSSQELLEKWSKIYDYNQTLTDSLKIQVVGIDKDYDSKDSISRDDMMTTNFKEKIWNSELKNEKFYGLFGHYHVLQDKVNQNEMCSFACQLIEESIYKPNQINSIVVYNTESEFYLPKNDQIPTTPEEKIDVVNHDGPLLLVKGINDLKAVSQKDITLFNLEAANSTYTNTQDLAGTKTNVMGPSILPSSTDKVTTDYFQYVILSKKSEALTPLE